MDTKTRKDAHLDACLNGPVESGIENGLSEYRFDHAGFPELDLEAIETSITLLGKRLEWPFVIGAMTGGTNRGGALNQSLGRAAVECGCGMELGSLRAALEDEAATGTFELRSQSIDPPLLFGNIGASHAGEPYASRLLRLCERLRLDCLMVHVNPLQEALQKDGDTKWSGIIERLSRLQERLKEVGTLLGVKEVSSGWSLEGAKHLAAIRPSIVETAGVGGTSFALVEGLLSDDPVLQRCARTFAGFGTDTATSIRNLRHCMPSTPIIASGGLRTGLELAVAIRLGATAGAMALPLLRAVSNGQQALMDLLSTVRREFVLTLFLTGSKDVAELKRTVLRDRSGHPVMGV